MLIRNAGGAGALTVGDGILVVQVLDPTRSAAGAFTLASGPLLAGPYEYLLFHGGVNGSNPADWFLRDFIPNPTPTPTPQVPNFRQETSLYAAIPSLTLLYGRSLIETLHERVGDEEQLRGRTDLSGYPMFNGGWARIIGEHGQRDGDPNGILGSGPKYDFDFVAFQGGQDVYRAEHADGSRDHAGFMVAVGSANSNVTHFTGAIAGTDQFTAESVGGYWTHFGSTGWYLDAVLQGTWYDARAASNRDIGLSTKGTGFASSLEGGYPFHFVGGWLIEPEAQLIYQTISLSDSNDIAAQVRFDDVDSLAGRVGVRFAKTWSLYGASDPCQVTAWLRPNLWREFRGDPLTQFSSETGFVPFHANLFGYWFEMNAGVSAAINRTTTVYANASYQEGLDGRSFAYDGKVGIRLNW
jgi:outer membrane autotransporter protein